MFDAATLKILGGVLLLVGSWIVIRLIMDCDRDNWSRTTEREYDPVDYPGHR